MNFKYIYLQKAPLTKKCFQKRVPGLLKEVQIEYAEKNIFIELVQVCKEPSGLGSPSEDGLYTTD